MARTITRILPGTDAAVQSQLNFIPYTSTSGSIAVTVPDGFVGLISDLSASGATTLTVKFGGVVKWQIDIPANFPYVHAFLGYLGGLNGEDILIEATGTAKINANVSVMFAGEKK